MLQQQMLKNQKIQAPAAKSTETQVIRKMVWPREALMPRSFPNAVWLTASSRAAKRTVAIVDATIAERPAIVAIAVVKKDPHLLKRAAMPTRRMRAEPESAIT